MDRLSDTIINESSYQQLSICYREALSELGVFEKHLSDDTGLIFTLWDKWGYSREELLGGKWEQLVHPDDRDDLLSLMGSFCAGASDKFRTEYRVRMKNGMYRWILNQGVVVSRDNEGLPLTFLGTDIDITELKKTHDELIQAKAHAEERAQEAETLRIAGTIITSSLDLEKAVNLVLEQAMLVVPYETAAVFVTTDERRLELVGLRSSLPEAPRNGSVFPIDHESPHWKVLNASTPVIEYHCIDPIPELGGFKTFLEYSWMGIPLRFQSRIIGIISFLSLSSLKPKHLRLGISFADHVSVALNNARQHQGTLEMASMDPLTKTYTRRWFFTKAEKIFKHSVRNSGDVTILMVDIDHFKRVNDTFGHTVGDLILQRVCQACMLCLRASDVMGRYGGEEFSIILPETGAREGLLVADRLRRSVEHADYRDIDQKVTVSVGSATSSSGAGYRSLHELIQSADTALYRAKETGRNRVCSHVPPVSQDTAPPATSERTETDEDGDGEEQ
ncbi:MAG: diguanylate cyclase [Spirochaetales bacterium]|nr:diguanylate cyclase [Spirochaetales bacterium]